LKKVVITYHEHNFYSAGGLKQLPGKLTVPFGTSYTVKMNMLYLIIRIVATDYKQYYELNLTN